MQKEEEEQEQEKEQMTSRLMTRDLFHNMEWVEEDEEAENLKI